jgi:ribonuclease PH
MHMIGFERPKLRLTEFAFVSQEFGPREPARGPFRPTDRALTRADQNAEPVTRKDRVVRSSSRGNGRLKRPQSNCC